MRRQSIDRGWEFIHGVPSGVLSGYGEGQGARIVDLPHDFTIETDTRPDAPGGSGSGFYAGGIGTYTKRLDIPEGYADRRVLVEFDGAYMNAVVSLNGHAVSRHHYGYTPFHADLTRHIKLGKVNRLAVTVNNAAEPNCRWYAGSGLYRHVDLLTAPMAHIAPWGIFAHTSHIVGATAFVTVETTVENHGAEARELWVSIGIEREEDRRSAGSGRVKIHLSPGSSAAARAAIPVEDAELWDIDSPRLYRVRAGLEDEGGPLDEDSVLFGIRTVSADSRNGFMLNGRALKLRGGCVHHDNGILGAASFYDSEFRKMELHKENGYNAIRCAHNPPSRDMLEACDRLGLVVIDEAFDSWIMAKNPHDYSQFFEADWEGDMEAFMRRDRNHPCIAMWSTGNEIPERGGLSDGALWAARLAEKVRSLDPTRLVTNAICSFFNGLDDEDAAQVRGELEAKYRSEGTVLNIDTVYGRKVWGRYTEAFAASLDVVGYNYLAHRYEVDHDTFPNRVICCLESKPMEMEQYWSSVERLPYVIGDFNWTSHDYIGEVGIGKASYIDPGSQARETQRAKYPWRLANASDFDLCGFPRPQLAYRKIAWGGDETYIASHNPANHGKHEILGRWAWPERENSWSWIGFEGRLVAVDVYSGADEVELVLNGNSLGRKPAGRGNRFTARFELAYEPGVLEAIGYRRGSRVSSDRLVSAGAPAGIAIALDRRSLVSDGQSLAFATIEIVDGEGRRVPAAAMKARAAVKGEARLAAFGTGIPSTTENYTRGEFTSYKGRLLAVVRAGYEPGVAELGVSVEGLGDKKAGIRIEAMP